MITRCLVNKNNFSTSAALAKVSVCALLSVILVILSANVVMFLPLCICPSVCLSQDNSKRCHKVLMNFLIGVN